LGFVEVWLVLDIRWFAIVDRSMSKSMRSDLALDALHT